MTTANHIFSCLSFFDTKQTQHGGVWNSVPTKRMLQRIHADSDKESKSDRSASLTFSPTRVINDSSRFSMSIVSEPRNRFRALGPANQPNVNQSTSNYDSQFV